MKPEDKKIHRIAIDNIDESTKTTWCGIKTDIFDDNILEDNIFYTCEGCKQAIEDHREMLINARRYVNSNNNQ